MLERRRQDDDVSTHAPVKERQNVFRFPSSIRSFNPRSREGATVRGPSVKVPRVVSTHAPVKERRAASSVVTTFSVFQPTLP